MLASEDEIQRDIVLAKQKVTELEDIAEKKRTARNARAARTTGGKSQSFAQRLGFLKRKPATEACPTKAVSASPSTSDGLPIAEAYSMRGVQ
jgi:hypothetical protein